MHVSLLYVTIIEFTLFLNSKRELYRSWQELKYSCSYTFVTHGYQNTELRDLRDCCNGNIKMKLNDEHAYALIVDLELVFYVYVYEWLSEYHSTNS